MTRVLHVQKVSGVSGSEAHLLSVLPLLRERDWDARMIVLHEGEEGARTFVDEMRTRGVPTEAWRMRGDLDPTVPLRLLRRRAAGLDAPLVRAAARGLPAGAPAQIPLRAAT
jgi:hypothetical protein